MRSLTTPLVFLLATWTVLPAAAQTTFTLTPSKDNTIYSENASQSNGAREYLFAGQTSNGAPRRALLAFDIVGALPAGATVESVTLTLTMSKTVAGDTPVSLHRVSADSNTAACSRRGC